MLAECRVCNVAAGTINDAAFDSGAMQELKFIRRIGPVQYEIAPGFVPHMRVPGTCYVNSDLEGLIFDELKAFCNSGGHGGFLPAVKQLANVAALPGIVQVQSMCMLILLVLGQDPLIR